MFKWLNSLVRTASARVNILKEMSFGIIDASPVISVGLPGCLMRKITLDESIEFRKGIFKKIAQPCVYAVYHRCQDEGSFALQLLQCFIQ